MDPFADHSDFERKLSTITRCLWLKGLYCFLLPTLLFSFFYSFIFTFFLLTSPLFLINSIFLIYPTLPCLITHYISFFYFPLLVTCYLPPSPLLPHPRVKKGSFAGAHVFPGGKLDDIDKSSAWLHYTDPSGIKDPLLSYKVCAIRETFEETGLLLAKNRGSATEPTNLQDIGDGSGVIMDGLYRKVKTENLELVTSKLKYVSRWITPEFAPRRFDAHFYMINLGPEDPELINQAIKHLGFGGNSSLENNINSVNDINGKDIKGTKAEKLNDEIVYFEWRSPREYLDMYCSGGRIQLVTAQIYQLLYMARFKRWQDLSYSAELYSNKVVPFTSYYHPSKTSGTNGTNGNTFSANITTFPGDHLYRSPVRIDTSDIENLEESTENSYNRLVDKLDLKNNIRHLYLIENQTSKIKTKSNL
ncbi:hypothetical protein BB560_003350 [Smittium megazygosporum]|uniref:Nudix hydrolase domain-containing protein n=1 Tax=Smittium megazygosporum TaxID=133381 RepID=A0A2T9ZCC0_9FUNG|nr:hypothetical protein BB560_003350 [Smittium megazygosporum]